MKSLFRVALLTCLFTLTSAYAQEELEPALTPVAGLPPAAAFELKDLEGDVHVLADYRGRVVVLNFWATWCPPCRREMPALERLHLKTADEKIRVIAVNVGEDFDTVFSFTGQLTPAPTFPMLFDAEATSMEPWKIRGLPTTYVVDPVGRIAYRAVGGREFDHPDLIAKLRELAAGGAPH